MPVQTNRFPCPAAHPVACRGPAVPPSRRRRGSARSLPEHIRQERLAAFRGLALVEESRNFGGRQVLACLQLLALRQHPGAEQDQPARPFAPGLFRPFRASARDHDTPVPWIPEEPLQGIHVALAHALGAMRGQPLPDVRQQPGMPNRQTRNSSLQKDPGPWQAGEEVCQRDDRSAWQTPAAAPSSSVAWNAPTKPLGCTLAPAPQAVAVQSAPEAFTSPERVAVPGGDCPRTDAAVAGSSPGPVFVAKSTTQFGLTCPVPADSSLAAKFSMLPQWFVVTGFVMKVASRVAAARNSPDACRAAALSPAVGSEQPPALPV